MAEAASPAAVSEEAAEGRGREYPKFYFQINHEKDHHPLVYRGYNRHSHGFCRKNSLQGHYIRYWYADAVYELRTLGIIEGYEDGTFKPDNSVTRAEMTVIMERFLKLMEERGLKDYYISDKFGIRFVKNDMYYGLKDAYGEDLRESENGIGFEHDGDRIKVFYKEKDESIESAILKLIAANGKDSEKCVVIRTDTTLNTLNGHYRIDLADTDIVYTDSDLARIAEADMTAAADGGPFNGDWMKKKIYNERLIDACTEYADPAGLGTSKSTRSYFEYNDYRAKDRFIFLPSSYELEFYDWNGIEFTL